MNNTSRQNLIVLLPFIAETKNICENFIYMLSSQSDLTFIYLQIRHKSAIVFHSCNSITNR